MLRLMVICATEGWRCAPCNGTGTINASWRFGKYLAGVPIASCERVEGSEDIIHNMPAGSSPDMLLPMTRPTQYSAVKPWVVFALVFGLCLFGPEERTVAAGRTVITIDQLRTMFAEMRANTDHKKWNVDGDLLWGYFFTDPDPRKLRPLADHLTKLGYRFVDIYPTDDKRTFFLHVEKVEHHTAESLNERNIAFYQLAEQFHLESYDGMDVGPVE